MRTLVLACFAAIGCYNPSFTECAITCGGMDNKACPSGFTCEQGVCRSSSGSCAGSGSDSAVDDGGTEILADADLTKWMFRKVVTVHMLALPAPLTDFPVLVRLPSDTDLATHAQDDAADIYFAKLGANSQLEKLKHEIEAFDTTTGALVAWVRVPQLPANADLTFYMLYGNATATPQMERAATWDASYTAVWHLGDGVGSDAVVDSTGAARHGVKDSNLLTPAMGAMGSGFSFGGTIADHFSIPTTGLPTGMFTLEAWLNVSVASGGTSRLLSTPTSFQSRYGVEYTGPYVGGGGSGDFTVDPVVTGDTSFTKNFIFPPNMWVHAMITWNSSVGGTEVYLNGFTGGTSTAIPSPPVRPDPGAMYFGGAPVIDKPGPLGTVDEVRLSTTVRSPAYAKAAYEIGRPGSTMVTLGPAQAAF